MTRSDSFRLDSDGIYKCEAFQEFGWQTHGFGTRVSSPPVDVTLRQIHSGCVVNAAGIEDRSRQGDALVTNEIGRSIGVRTADCVPILLLDSKNRAVAAVHAGWRGTAAEIVRCALEQLASDFESAASDIYAAIGPCIRSCCYEVGPDVARQFARFFPDGTPRVGNTRLNLPGINRRQMEEAGVLPARIFDCALCTACHSDQFFSYRREPGNPGRMIAAISRLA